MRRNMSVSALTSAILLAACAQSEPPTDPAEVRAEVEAYIATFASDDPAAISAFFAANAMQMPPDEAAITGRGAIEAAYAEFLAANDLALSTSVEDLQVSGDLAVARASFRQSMTPKAGGEMTEEVGSWIMVWGRQSDGSWKISMEMWSAYPPQ